MNVIIGVKVKYEKEEKTMKGEEGRESQFQQID